MSVRLLALLAAVLALLVASGPSAALAQADAPEIGEAQAAIVCDGSGAELWSLNPTLTLPPASITKVMTAMLALDTGRDLDAPVTVVENAPGGNSQTAGYEVGDVTTLRDLLLATLVYSGNDAALNVASIVGGSEAAFVSLMNERAQELGMTNTHFANPHGLDQDDHYSCVRDLVVMGRYALEHYPFIARAVRYDAVELTIGDDVETLYSTDELMGAYEGLLGIKTGAVESGTGFLGASKRDGVTLYTVVLGCDSSDGRFADTASIMDWAYAHAYRWRTSSRAGSVYRMSPSATDLAARLLVRAPLRMGAYAVPGDPISYRRSIADHHLLMDPGEPVAALWWRQNGRLAGASSLATDGTLYEAPSINTFALPLFENATTRRVA